MTRPPHHGDFDRLSKAVIASDARADRGEDVPVIIAETVDPETAIYFAKQRGSRLIPHWDALLPEQQARLVAMWLDGLLAGHKLGKLQERRP